MGSSRETSSSCVDVCVNRLKAIDEMRYRQCQPAAALSGAGGGGGPSGRSGPHRPREPVACPFADESAGPRRTRNAGRLACVRPLGRAPAERAAVISCQILPADRLVGLKL